MLRVLLLYLLLVPLCLRGQEGGMVHHVRPIQAKSDTIWVLPADDSLKHDTVQVFLQPESRLNVDTKVYEYERSKWGYGLEFNSGVGFLTGSLHKLATHQILLGMAYDVQYKNFYTSIMVQAGFSKARTDRDYLLKGHRFRIPDGSNLVSFFFGIRMGYVVFENKCFRLIPYAALGTADFLPDEDEASDERLTDQFSQRAKMSGHIGIDLHIKLIDNLIGGKMMQLRLRYDLSNDGFMGATGYMHTCTLGVGFNSYKAYRIYSDN